MKLFSPYTKTQTNLEIQETLVEPIKPKITNEDNITKKLKSNIISVDQKKAVDKVDREFLY